MEWHDGKHRCRWANPKNELYIRYHDEEWGKLVRDDAKLFEMLILECFQEGLSWECILNKREAFRAAFDEFDLDKVCGYDEAKEEALRKRAYQKHVASDRAWRENVPRHILFHGRTERWIPRMRIRVRRKKLQT